MNSELEGQDIVAPQAEVIPTVSASKRDAEEAGIEVPDAKKAKTSVEGTKTAETAKKEDAAPATDKTTNDIVPPIRHEGPDSLLSDHQKVQAAAEAADDDDENEEADQTGVTAATEATEGDGSGDEESDVGEVSEDELAALKAEAGEEEPEEEEKPAGRRSSRRTKEKLDYAALAKAQGLDGDDSD